MTELNEKIASEIGERVFGLAIKTLWKSQEQRPGAGVRRSSCRGRNGYQVAARYEYKGGPLRDKVDRFATAQSTNGKIILVTMQEPRDICIRTIVDVGRTMQFGTHDYGKNGLAAELAGSILSCTNTTKDRAQIVTVSETRVQSILGPRQPKLLFHPAMAAILAPAQEVQAAEAAQARRGLTWRSLLPGQKPAAKPAPRPLPSGMCQVLKSLPLRKSLLFVVSDFMNFNEEDQQALFDAGNYHDVICLVIRDIRELELPEGDYAYTLKDIVSGQTQVIMLNAANRAQYHKNAQAQLGRLGEIFERANCSWDVFSTGQTAGQVNIQMVTLFGDHRK